MRESKKIQLQYSKLLLEDLELAIKHKKLRYKMDLLEFWNLSTIAKHINFEDLEEKEKLLEKFKIPREKIHI